MRYSDAGRDMNFVAFDEIGLGEDFSNPGGQRAGCREIVGFTLHYCKLIATKTRDDIGLAGHARNATGNLAQKRIADGVAEGVVYVLEMIEIEIEHRNWLSTALARGKCLIEPLDKGSAIGERGQRILLCEIGNRLIHLDHSQGMTSRRPYKSHNHAADDEPSDKYDPRAMIPHRQRSAWHRPYHHSQPALTVGDEVSGPVTIERECGPRHWLS